MPYAFSSPLPLLVVLILLSTRRSSRSTFTVCQDTPITVHFRLRCGKSSVFRISSVECSF